MYFILSNFQGVRIFSAGLDLNEFNKPDDLNRLRAFWSKLQDLFLKMYGSGEITSTAAINVSLISLDNQIRYLLI